MSSRPRVRPSRRSTWCPCESARLLSPFLSLTPGRRSPLPKAKLRFRCLLFSLYYCCVLCRVCTVYFIWSLSVIGLACAPISFGKPGGHVCRGAHTLRCRPMVLGESCPWTSPALSATRFVSIPLVQGHVDVAADPLSPVKQPERIRRCGLGAKGGLRTGHPGGPTTFLVSRTPVLRAARTDRRGPVRL